MKILDALSSGTKGHKAYLYKDKSTTMHVISHACFSLKLTLKTTRRGHLKPFQKIGKALSSRGNLGNFHNSIEN